MLTAKLHFLREKLSPSMGGLFLLLVFFIYGLINNMSMSYMGNTSKNMEEYIISNFLWHIIFFILKILAVYISAGLVLGIIVHLAVLSYSYFFDREISWRKSFLLNIIFSFIIYIVIFLKDIIMYPQVYMNNFYIKSGINKIIVDFLADNISPVIFTILQVALALAICVLFAAALFKLKNKILYWIPGAVCVFILFAFILSCFDKVSPAKDEPNVLILASDALRADHFSGYGYNRATTPNIDRLINEGVSFRNAYIEVPRTFPSWVSILTGRFSATHGIRHMFPTSMDLNRDFKSIVKILKGHGYSSSVVADYAGDIFSRIDLGFDTVDAPYFNSDYVVDQIILEAHAFLLPFLTNKAGLEIFPVLKDSAYFCPAEFVKDRIIRTVKNSESPFFIATFFSSTHFPYAAPYPYYKMFRAKNYTGPYKYFKQRIVSFDGEKGSAMTGDDIKQVRALYDGGLKSFDDAVGGILEFLSDNKILDNTIVIVLSDHGENLYEGTLGMGHGEHFRGPYAVKVPLIIRYPGIGLKKTEISGTVRLADIAPTILSILNKPVPGYMEGVSLMPLISGKKTAKLCAFGETGIWFDNTVRDDLFFQKLRIIYPDITNIGAMDPYLDRQIVLRDDYRDIVNFARHRYVFDGRYKLIYMPLKDRIVYELYDTVNDPDEKIDIISIDSKNFRRLRNILFEWVQRNGDVIVSKDYIYPLLRY